MLIDIWKHYSQVVEEMVETISQHSSLKILQHQDSVDQEPNTSSHSINDWSETENENLSQTFYPINERKKKK